MDERVRSERERAKRGSECSCRAAAAIRHAQVLFADDAEGLARHVVVPDVPVVVLHSVLAHHWVKVADATGVEHLVGEGGRGTGE